MTNELWWKGSVQLFEQTGDLLTPLARPPRAAEALALPGIFTFPPFRGPS